MNILDFSGKSVIVTGAAGGIGRAILKGFYDRGAKVYATSTSQSKLDKLFEEFKDKTRVFGAVVDMKDRGGVEAICQAALEKMNSIDILVANAGMTHDGLAMRMTNEDWQEVIDVNLTANFILNREAGKIMMKQRSGRVINIASVVGFMGNAGQANYVASKAGLVGMTKSMAIEFASRGVTYNCVAPGFIETAMTDILSDKVKEEIKKKIPLGHQGKPEDIAHAVLFLASEGASYITGTTLHVNGGMAMF